MVRGGIPRHVFIAWMALRGRPKTLVKIKDWGIVQSELCVHCWRDPETEDHLFYDSQMAK